MDPLLRELLHHADPDQRRQGIEIARALGVGVVDQLAADLIAGDVLWPPQRGWAPELLDLLLERAPQSTWAGRVRVLYAACPGVDAVLPRIVRALPQLTGVDLAWSDVTDIGSLRGLAGLRTLRLRGCTRLTELAPLADLAGLEALDLSRIAAWNLDPLAGLEHLTELGLERMRGLGSLRPLPGGLRGLRLSETQLGEPLVVGDRPLQRLSVSSVGDLPGRDAFPALRALELDRGPPSRLAGWPVTRLHLRGLPERGALARMDGLRWLQLQQGHHLRDWPPDLRVLDSHQSTGLPSAWPDDVRPSPRLLRVASLPDSHPFRHTWWDAARHWRAGGHAWRLAPLADLPIHARRLMQMHRDLGLGLQEARQLLELLATGQMYALTAAEAVSLQSLLARSGVPTTRAPWDGAL